MCNFLCILHIHVYIYAHKYTYIIARSSNIQTPFTSKRKRNFQPEVTLSKRLRLRNRIADARNSQRAQIAIAIALPFRNGLYQICGHFHLSSPSSRRGGIFPLLEVTNKYLLTICAQFTCQCDLCVYAILSRQSASEACVSAVSLSRSVLINVCSVDSLIYGYCPDKVKWWQFLLGSLTFVGQSWIWKKTSRC